MDGQAGYQADANGEGEEVDKCLIDVRCIIVGDEMFDIAPQNAQRNARWRGLGASGFPASGAP